MSEKMTLELLKLYNRALKCVPNSPKQLEILRMIEKRKLGLM